MNMEISIKEVLKETYLYQNMWLNIVIGNKKLYFKKKSWNYKNAL